jgi:hypothetical protein
LFVSSNQYPWITLINICFPACPLQRFLIRMSPV